MRIPDPSTFLPPLVLAWANIFGTALLVYCAVRAFIGMWRLDRQRKELAMQITEVRTLNAMLQDRLQQLPDIKKNQEWIDKVMREVSDGS